MEEARDKTLLEVLREMHERRRRRQPPRARTAADASAALSTPPARGVGVSLHAGNPSTGAGAGAAGAGTPLIVPPPQTQQGGRRRKRGFQLFGDVGSPPSETNSASEGAGADMADMPDTQESASSADPTVLSSLPSQTPQVLRVTDAMAGGLAQRPAGAPEARSLPAPGANTAQGVCDPPSAPMRGSALDFDGDSRVGGAEGSLGRTASTAGVGAAASTPASSMGVKGPAETDVPRGAPPPPPPAQAVAAGAAGGSGPPMPMPVPAASIRPGSLAPDCAMPPPPLPPAGGRRRKKGFQLFGANGARAHAPAHAPLHTNTHTAALGVVAARQLPPPPPPPPPPGPAENAGVLPPAAAPAAEPVQVKTATQGPGDVGGDLPTTLTARSASAAAAAAATAAAGFDLATFGMMSQMSQGAAQAERAVETDDPGLGPTTGGGFFALSNWPAAPAGTTPDRASPQAGRYLSSPVQCTSRVVLTCSIREDAGAAMQSRGRGVGGSSFFSGLTESDAETGCDASAPSAPAVPPFMEVDFDAPGLSGIDNDHDHTQADGGIHDDVASRAASAPTPRTPARVAVALSPTTADTDVSQVPCTSRIVLTCSIREEEEKPARNSPLCMSGEGAGMLGDGVRSGTENLLNFDDDLEINDVHDGDGGRDADEDVIASPPRDPPPAGVGHPGSRTTEGLLGSQEAKGTGMRHAREEAPPHDRAPAGTQGAVEDACSRGQTNADDGGGVDDDAHVVVELTVGGADGGGGGGGGSSNASSEAESDSSATTRECCPAMTLPPEPQEPLETGTQMEAAPASVHASSPTAAPPAGGAVGVDADAACTSTNDIPPPTTPPTTAAGQSEWVPVGEASPPLQTDGCGTSSNDDFLVASAEAADAPVGTGTPAGRKRKRTSTERVKARSRFKHVIATQTPSTAGRGGSATPAGGSRCGTPEGPHGGRGQQGGAPRTPTSLGSPATAAATPAAREARTPLAGTGATPREMTESAASAAPTPAVRKRKRGVARRNRHRRSSSVVETPSQRRERRREKRRRELRLAAKFLDDAAVEVRKRPKGRRGKKGEKPDGELDYDANLSGSTVTVSTTSDTGSEDDSESDLSFVEAESSGSSSEDIRAHRKRLALMSQFEADEDGNVTLPAVPGRAEGKDVVVKKAPQGIRGIFDTATLQRFEDIDDSDETDISLESIEESEEDEEDAEADDADADAEHPRQYRRLTHPQQHPPSGWRGGGLPRGPAHHYNHHDHRYGSRAPLGGTPLVSNHPQRVTDHQLPPPLPSSAYIPTTASTSPAPPHGVGGMPPVGSWQPSQPQPQQHPQQRFYGTPAALPTPPVVAMGNSCTNTITNNNAAYSHAPGVVFPPQPQYPRPMQSPPPHTRPPPAAGAAGPGFVPASACVGDSYMGPDLGGGRRALQPPAAPRPALVANSAHPAGGVAGVPTGGYPKPTPFIPHAGTGVGVGAPLSRPGPSGLQGIHGGAQPNPVAAGPPPPAPLRPLPFTGVSGTAASPFGRGAGGGPPQQLGNVRPSVPQLNRPVPFNPSR